MRTTSNYSLLLPDEEDFYSVGDPDANMEIIDTQMKSNQTKADSVTTDCNNDYMDRNRFFINNSERILMKMEAIISASITGCLALAGIIITNVMSNKKIEHQLETAQAVQNCKIDQLTIEVREHNNFAKRMPVVEEQIKVINHRIAGLEKGRN